MGSKIEVGGFGDSKLQLIVLLELTVGGFGDSKLQLIVLLELTVPMSVEAQLCERYECLLTIHAFCSFPRCYPISAVYTCSLSEVDSA